MRTPWREALDGKIKVMRDLRTNTARRFADTYFLESRTLQRTVDSGRLEHAATQLSDHYCDLLERDIRRTEPFWVSRDVSAEIIRRMGEWRNSNPGLILAPYRRVDRPLPSGLIWLASPFLMAGVEEDPEAMWVRAVYFGDSRPVAYAKHRSRRGMEIGNDSSSLGVVSFVDVRRAGFTSRDGCGHVPWIHAPLEEGTNLKEYGSMIRRNTPDIDEASFSVTFWGVAFCRMFFQMMEEKVLLHGGSGLEREARKEAKRNGFEPSVQVVEWRKANYRYPKDHVPSQVEWSCRWAVRSHQRRLKSGKVIQVRSCVKGPPDKPLKAIDHRVHVVKR